MSGASFKYSRAAANVGAVAVVNPSSAIISASEALLVSSSSMINAWGMGMSPQQRGSMV